MLRTIFLNVSGQCNLSCAYCFAAQGAYRDGPRMMDGGTARAAIDCLFGNMGRARSGEVVFFGGEPLLNWPVLERATTYAAKEAAKRGKQIRFSITSNGTLFSREVVQFLRLHRFRITVSVDSHEASVNDRLRPQSGAGSTLESVLRGLALFDASDSICLRPTITPANTDLAGFMRHFGTYECVKSVAFSPVQHETGCPTSCDVASYKKASEAYLDYLFAEWEQRNFIYPHQFMGSIYIYRNLDKLSKPLHCCSATGRTVSVSTTGRFYFCPLLNDVEEFRLGDVETGLDRDALRRLTARLDVSNKQKCRNCSLKMACGGGCHRLNHFSTSSVDTPSAENCEYTQFNLQCAQRIAAKADEWVSHYMKAEPGGPEPAPE
jgi:uncharacterized protein